MLKRGVTMEYSFKASLETFVKEMQSLEITFPVVMTLINGVCGLSSEIIQKFINEMPETEEEQEKYYFERIDTVEIADDILERFAVAEILLPKSFIVTLVSQFDALMGGLIRSIFYTKPEILNASQKKHSVI